MHAHDKALAPTRADLIRDAVRVAHGAESAGWFDDVHDAGARRSLALELLQQPNNDPLEEGWLQAMRAAGASSLAHPTETCACGQPVALHREVNDREAVVVHVFCRDAELDPTIRKYRRQAQEAFPYAVAVVLLIAHGRSSARSRDAWAVIEAIDGGRKLLPALSRFFWTTSGDVRASRRIPAWIARPGVSVSTARRLMRGVHKREDDMEFGEPDWRRDARWVPVAEMLAFLTRTKLQVVYPPTLRLEESLGEVMALPLPARRALLRATVRHLQREGADGWRSILRGRIPGAQAHRPPPMPYTVSAPNGWEACALVTEAGVEREGSTLDHCVGRYARDVVRGEAHVFSLRGPTRRDKATLLVRGSDSDVPGAQLQLAGPSNEPFPLAALEAAVHVLREIYPEGTDIIFS